MNLGTTSGCYTFPFQENFKILGCAVEERMQSANKALKKIKEWETKRMLRWFRFKRHEDVLGCLAIMDHAKWPGRYDTNGLTFPIRNNCRKCVACQGIGL